MKLNKEMTKKGVKNLLLSTLHMFIFNIISIPIFMLIYIDSKYIGESTRIIDKLPSKVKLFECNYFFVILSTVLFLLAFSIFYTNFFKKDLTKHVKTHLLFIVLFIVITACFCFVEFMIYCVIRVLTLGLFISVINYPDYVANLACLYLIGYILIDILISFRKMKYNNKTKIDERKIENQIK